MSQSQNSVDSISLISFQYKKMRDKDKEKIRRNWVILLTDLDAKALTPYFISAFVLVPDEDEKIRTFSTPKDQNDVFLKMIMKKGENAYNTLLLALEKTGNQHIVRSLEEGGRDSGKYLFR